MWGQKSEKTLLQDAIPRHAVRVSPLHLLNFYPTVQLGYEANIRNRFSIYTEGGVAVNITQRDERFLDKRGIKLKVEPRYYLSASRKGHVLWYAAGEAYYNKINFERKTRLIGCFDLDCQFRYERQSLEKGTYREHGFGIKGGMMIGRNRFFVDINTGFAIRIIDYSLPELPVGWEGDGRAWYDIPNETDRTAFTPLVGVRLGYHLINRRL